jgi:hypothetical protein
MHYNVDHDDQNFIYNEFINRLRKRLSLIREITICPRIICHHLLTESPSFSIDLPQYFFILHFFPGELGGKIAKALLDSYNNLADETSEPSVVDANDREICARINRFFDFL